VTSDVAQSECNVHSSLIMRPVAINLTWHVELTNHFFSFTAKIVTEKLLGSHEYRNSKSVSVYISMDGEINTREVIRNIFDTRKSLKTFSRVFLSRSDSCGGKLVTFFSPF
jgi:hypothetical protein